MSRSFRARSAGPYLAAVLFLVAAAAPAVAQWEVMNLHPEAMFDSYALSVRDGRQAGYTRVPGNLEEHAALWSGTATSWVDLNPPGALQSRANSVAGSQQAGWAWPFEPPEPGGLGVRHPVLWSGTAASWVDMSFPASAGELNGNAGGQQIGTAYFGPNTHAELWTGTPGSPLDLHPAAASWSWGHDTDGAQQVGYAWTTNPRASLWTGTAASWVNLHPNAALSSMAYSVHGGQQVGWGSYPFNQRAHLWKGTKNSLVDLHPAGAITSVAWGVHDGQQVGTASFANGERASLWSGTAASWVDLDAALPPEYSLSEAKDIWHASGSTYVVGHAYNTATMHYDALMWVSPPVWTNLGSALGGVSGLPELSGAGTLLTGMPASLRLSSAAPLAPMFLFLSLSSTPTPFKGGLLVPVPPLAALPLATDAAGELQIPLAAWPPGASGLSLYLQSAIQDAAAPKGVALSNALRADVP